MNFRRFGFLCLLMLAAALSRVVPHPPNLAPMAAVALFGAAMFEKRWMAVVMPLAALLFSDILIQATYLLVRDTSWASWQPYWGFYQGQWMNYACLLVTIGLGFLLRDRRSLGMIGGVTLANAVIFFVLSNFAVWLQGGMAVYPRTFAGLMLCYEQAIPFFQYSLMGDVLYVTLLFGSLALAEARFPAIQRPVAATV